MTAEQKHREFYINGVTTWESVDFDIFSKESDVEKVKAKSIRCIEYQAYEQLQSSYNDLKKKLSVDFQYQFIEELKDENEKLKNKLLQFEGMTFSENTEITQLKLNNEALAYQIKSLSENKLDEIEQLKADLENRKKV